MTGSQAKIEELDGDAKPGAGAAATKGDKKHTRTRTRSASGDTKFRGRLVECFERIAVALEQRGDEELADIMREDGPVMATGLTSLTGLVAPLRLPLLFVLAVVEPLLAFGRLFRVIAYRFVDRRERRAAERAAHEQDGPPPEWSAASDLPAS